MGAITRRFLSSIEPILAGLNSFCKELTVYLLPGWHHLILAQFYSSASAIIKSTNCTILKHMTRHSDQQMRHRSRWRYVTLHHS